MNTTRVGNVPYRVETPRLLLRHWSPEDAAALRAVLAASADHLRPWIPFMKDEPRTFGQTCQWLREARASFDQDQAWHYAVFDRETGDLLGGNMLNPRVGAGGLELGYWTSVEAVRRGYAREATCAMVRCAFELHRVERTEIHCAPENGASAAIPAALGFRHEATLKNRSKNTEGQVHDLMIWTLPDTEYPDEHCARLPCLAWDCAGRPMALAEPGLLPEEGA